MLRNSWLKWFENRLNYQRLVRRGLRRRGSSSRGRTAAQNRPVPMQVCEQLEDRTLLTTFFVDNTVDESDGNFGAGDLSLREAMEQADANPGADVIRFAAGLEGAAFQITLGALPVIDEDLQILGTVGNAQTINGQGLVINAAGTGNSTTFGLQSVRLNLEPNIAGLTINAVNDGTANVTLFNTVITNAAAEGIKFSADTGGIVNLTAGVVTIASNGDVAASAGILGEIGVSAAGAESLTSPGSFATANLDLSTLRISGQRLEGLKLDVRDGGKVTTPMAIRNSSFADNGAGNQRSGVLFTADGTGSNISASFDSSNADRATGAGFEFKASNGGNMAVGMTNVRANNVRSDGLNVHVDGATAVFAINGFTSTGALGDGAEIVATNNSLLGINQFNNVTLTNAGRSGLVVSTLAGSTLNAFNATGVDTSNNGLNGVLITTLTSTSNFNIADLTTVNNLLRGVQSGTGAMGTSTQVFTNMTSTSNRSSEPLGIGVSSMSTLNLSVTGGTLSSALATIPKNSIFSAISGGSTANLTFAGLNLNGSLSSGIVLDYTGASQGTVNISDTTSTGNRRVGVAIFARQGSDVDGNFTNVDVSNAGTTAPANGIRLDVVGLGSTGDFTFNDVTVDGAAAAGISLFYNAGATGSVNAFNNISAQNTGGDGVSVIVRGLGTQLTAFNANTVNVSGAGLGTTATADGLDISVLGPMAMGTFNIQNLTADGAGGRGVKIEGQNAATIGLNIDGFSADNNQLEGVAIDLGTIAAGTKMLGAVFANGTASSNGLAFMATLSGVRTRATGNGTDASIQFDMVSTNSNTNDGLEFFGDAGASLAVDLSNGTAALGNADNGVQFVGDGANTDVALTSTVAGNVFDGNGAIGVDVLLTNGVTANDITVQGSASMNQADGIRVTANDATGVTVNNLQVTGNAQVNSNLGDGLVVDLDSVTGINTLDLSSLNVTGNTGDQINVSLANMTLADVSLDNINADGPGAGMGMGDGVEFTLDNTMITNSLSLSGINATNNGEDGLELNFLNGATIPAMSVIDLGTFNDNGQHGVNINVTGSTVALDIINSMANMAFIASASNNGVHGINVSLNNATLTMNSVDSQQLMGNGGAGFNVQAAVPSNFLSGGSFTNNMITDNGSFGFHGIFNGGTFDISIGSRTTAGQGNFFDNNTGAGIAIDMVQNTIGRLAIVDNTIIGTNSGGAVFVGEGIFIRQLGTSNPAQATNSLVDGGGPGLLIQNNRIGVDDMDMPAGNASYGITFQVEEQSTITGLHVFDNQISNNGDDGISFRRFDEVTIADFRIEANLIEGNMGDGIELTGENDDNSIMDVTIGPDAPTVAQLITDSTTTSLPTPPARGNTIRNNSGDGIRLQVNADAGLDVDIRANTITGNGDDGIGLNEIVLDASDARQISGVWVQNTISDNADRGVQIVAVTSGTPTGGSGGFVPDFRGAGLAQGIYARENIIGAVLDQFGQVVPGFDGNGSTGIDISGASRSTWIDTEIIRNGRAVIGNRAVGHGIDLSVFARDVVLDNNLVRENFQDGIEINPSQISFMNVDMTRNRVQQNMGRGIDILTQDRGDTRISITNGNVINSNLEEGIYSVVTASNTQNQSNFANAALQQDGSVTTSLATASLIIDNATISNNGDPSVVGNLVASAGLVVRVGTQDAPSVFGTNHFATAGAVPINQHPSFFNGGGYLQLTNTTLQGNFGDDVFIHGFRSTVNPGTIGGTWSDTMFAPTNTAQGDPLARLDVNWGTTTAGNGNTFDSIDVLNGLRRGTPDNQAGAFYNNTEGTFKSRTNNLTPGGPFAQSNGATRRRNAQRAPVRVYNGGVTLNPTTNGLAFQFPGMGDSTFRLLTGASTGIAADLDLFSGGDGFLFDDNPIGGDFSPIENFNDAFGIGFVGAGTFGELPFGWGTF